MQDSVSYNDMDIDPKDIIGDRGTLARGLRLLYLLAEFGRPVGLAELTAASGYTKPTVFRLARTLVELGFVKQSPQNSFYSLTPRVLSLGHKYLAGMSLRDHALPRMHNLVEQFDENVSLAVLDGTDVVYIERLETNATGLTFKLSVGSRMPAYGSSMGRCILAWLPEAQRSEILDKSNFEKFTEFTIYERAKIEEAIANARRLGFSINDQETEIGVISIGVAIFDCDAVPIGGMNFAAPSTRISRRFLEEEVAPVLMKYANEISCASPFTNLGGG